MINEMIENLGIDEYELYGKEMAKLDIPIKEKLGKLILVTSINPTPLGEGKTTTSIGLCDSLNKIGVSSIVSLREPSMGPVFGKKGGAVGAGKAKIIPETKINLNFTGDFHAITYANNLICAVVDNHIHQGNKLNIKKVVFKRCLDVNDRSLRHVIINGEETGFVITPASEVMGVVGLSENIEDLRRNLGNIIVGYNEKDEEIYVKDLKLVDSLLFVLEDAFKPNLVKTLYNHPAIVHTGPFANISYGASSVKSIKVAMSLCDYTVTEAGFGSDTGAIKFFDILGRKANIYPDVIVVNVTIRALSYHGNGNIKEGIDNLKYHVENMKKFSSNVIVSLNKFDDDKDEDIEFIRDYLDKMDTKLCVSSMYSNGEHGALDLANEIIKMEPNKIKFNIYNLKDSLYEKLDKMKDMFGCNKLVYSNEIKEKLDFYNKKYNKLPICICKTPYSITDNDKMLGYPKNFDMTITDVSVYNGAGYIVIYMGNVLTMPGLAKESNYLKDLYR